MPTTNTFNLELMEQGNINTFDLYNENLVISELLLARQYEDVITNVNEATIEQKLYIIINPGTPDDTKIAIRLSPTRVRLISPLDMAKLYKTGQPTYSFSEGAWRTTGYHLTRTFVIGANSFIDFDMGYDVFITALSSNVVARVRFYRDETLRTNDTTPGNQAVNSFFIHDVPIDTPGRFKLFKVFLLSGDAMVPARLYNRTNAQATVNFEVEYQSY